MDIEALRRIVHSLPGVSEAPHHDKVSFRVGGKIFATVPPDQQHVHVMLDDDLARAAVLTHPDCLEELWWGRRLSGVRMRLADVDEDLATALLEEAHARRQPPKSAERKRTVSTERVSAEGPAADGDPDVHGSRD